MNANPFLLQKQIRENASDLQDFARDLKQWGEEMKRKEDSLKGDVKPSNRPKIRKINASKSEKKVKEQPIKSSSKTGTDYAAWEKFDVDAELERLDGDINDDSELTDECNENMYDEAILEKEKGNKCVKKQDWDGAVKCYTKAIDCYSFDPIFYANRALCYLKKSMFEKAERDCSMSLNLDQTYVKAYQRRAVARAELNKFEHAEQDYLRVLELEPKNNESRKELEKLRQKMRKIEETSIKSSDQRPVSKFTASRSKLATNRSDTNNLFESNKVSTRISEPVSPVIDDSKPSSTWTSSNDIIIVKPVNKQPHLRSQKPLKRIEIMEETGIQGIHISQVKEYNEAIKTHVVEKKEIVEKPTEINFSNILLESDKETVANESVKNSVNEKIEKDAKNNEEFPDEPISEFKKKQIIRNLRNTQHHSAWPKPNQQSTHVTSDDLKIIEKTNPKEEKNLINSDKKFSETDAAISLISPKNSVQFYSSWKNFKSTEEKYKYLKKINPEEIPRLFQNSLESNIFSSIVDILAKQFIENKDAVSGLLRYFSQVKRFNTITMFMTDDDKSNLWKLFDYMKESNELDREDFDKLIQIYEL